uniref:Leukocyte receptor cluster member 1 homolog n=1 Tax=Schistocephalus solidus TaxID=70667 RepID=A0A0V0J865_SCHSO
MNILPKKRWHVKNKDNAARVEADEAKDRRKKQADAIRSLIATQEARADYLRKKSKGLPGSEINLSAGQTLRLFADAEENRDINATNEEYEAEKKEAKESYEKKIGLLRYMGETSEGKVSEKPWWSEVPLHRKKSNKVSVAVSEEIDLKKKSRLDPLYAMKKVEENFAQRREMQSLMEKKERAAAASCINAYPSFFPDDIKNPEGRRVSIPRVDEASSITSGISLSSSQSCPRDSNSAGTTTLCTSNNKASLLERMRAERLARERAERERAAVLICRSMGLSTTKQFSTAEEEKVVDERQLPFNSAFNPELSSLAAERRHQYRESRKRRLS